MKQILSFVYIGYLVFVILLIFFGRKKPTQRLSWLLVLIFLPGIGVFFYLLLGSESYWAYKRRRIRKRHRHLFDELDRLSQTAEASVEEPASFQVFQERYARSTVSTNNGLEIYTNGFAKFEQLFQDLREAEDHINVQYFTIHNDAIGKELIGILKEKAQAGVEVKLLYDSFGCFFTLVRPLFWELKQAGGQVKGIRPYARALNYRNHRKLVVIDGKIGYLGGMNAGEHYRSGVAGRTWRDTHIRIEGQSVHELQYIFVSDWIASSPKGKIGFKQRLRHYFPEPSVQGYLETQIVANGLYSKYSYDDVINLSYFNLINQAKKRLWIQTPYFSPSEPILQSLKVLALGGVDVRIMTSGYYAFGGLFHHNIRNYYVRQLIASGVRVFKYSGILHAKTMLIDDDSLVIGTVNLNVRSLERDDELYASFKSFEQNKLYQEIFLADLAQSAELDYAQFRKESLASRILESLVSLFSPLS